MIKYICILFSVLLFACNSSKSSYPDDFSMSYIMSNALMNTNLNITVNTESIKLDYKDGTKNINKNYVFTIKESDVNSLYKYAKSKEFMTMKSPESEHLTDMPSQEITGKYDGKSNTISFGQVKNPPAEIAGLKDKIFQIMTNYKRDWKIETDME